LENKFNPLTYTPAFALLLGICSAIFLSGKGYSAAISLIVSLFLTAAWIFLGTAKNVKNYLNVFAWTLILVLAFSVFCLVRINHKNEYPPTINCLGTVLSARDWGKTNCALLISTEYGRVAAYVPRQTAPETGSKVKIEAATVDFKRAKKKGEFDEFYFWKAKRADKKCVVLDIETVARPNMFYRFRNGLERRITGKLPQRTADYMLAITLGEGSRALSELHKASGTSHLLAVSGFHVAILAGVAAFLFRRKKYRVFLVSAAVWGYVLLSGAASGAIRAALMLQIALLSLYAGAPVNSFNSVSVAGILLLLFNPYSFYDLAWQLSMLCALFICTFENSFDFISASLISMLIWFVTAARAALSFKHLPAVGIFMNIIAIPVFSLLFPLLMLLSLPALIGLPLGGFFAGICEYMLEAWEIFSNFAVTVCPFEFHYTAVMSAVSGFVFFWFAAERAQYPKINRIFVSLLASILVVICVQM